MARAQFCWHKTYYWVLMHGESNGMASKDISTMGINLKGSRIEGEKIMSKEEDFLLWEY